MGHMGKANDATENMGASLITYRNGVQGAFDVFPPVGGFGQTSDPVMAGNM